MPACQHTLVHGVPGPCWSWGYDTPKAPGAASGTRGNGLRKRGLPGAWLRHTLQLHISKPPPPGPSWGKPLPFLFITQQGRGISSQLKCQRSSWPPKKRSQAGNLKGLRTPVLPVLLLPHHQQPPGLYSQPACAPRAPRWLCRAPLPPSRASLPNQRQLFRATSPHSLCPAEPSGTAGWDAGQTGCQWEAEVATIPRDQHAA